MKPEVNRVHRITQHILWLLVLYAVFDVVYTWVQLQRFIAEAVASEVNLIRTPLAIIGDALLLLAATVSSRLDKRWGSVAAVVFSTWLLYRAEQKWFSIASAVELPPLSRGVISYWFSYAGGGWDLPRIAIAIVILIYALVTLIGLPSQSTRELASTTGAK